MNFQYEIEIRFHVNHIQTIYLLIQTIINEKF